MNQQQQALERANQVRLALMHLKADLHAGRVTVPEALEMDDAQPMKVYDLLAAQRGWGPVKATAVMRDLGIGHGPRRRVRDLTSRQLRLLAELVSDRAAA